MAIAFIEYVSSVIRVFNDDNAVYGQKYDYIAHVRWLDPETVEVFGVRTRCHWCVVDTLQRWQEVESVD